MISRHAECDLGCRIVIYRERDPTALVELMREGKESEAVRARPRGTYLRRNRPEISSEIERNTSTASAPIMPKAIIIFSDCA